MIAGLLNVWESSVRATHRFLSERERERIKRYVPQTLREVPCLLVAEENGAAVAFAGIDGQKLEMLFVSAEKRGQGIGKRLLEHAVAVCGVNELTVNEQNPQAIGFYAHMGFRTYKRSETDEQGAPYPILHMKREDIKAIQYTVPADSVKERYPQQTYDVLEQNDQITFKYFDRIQNDNSAFFDKYRNNWLHILTDDAGENYNRATVYPEIADEMHEKLDEIQQAFRENRRGVLETVQTGTEA